MNHRILLVDDEPFVLNALRRKLRKKFDFDLASGGRQALEMMEASGPYAVVVSDMQMPDVDGLELLCQVRRQFPDTVRIMLTGNAEQKTAVDAVNQGHIFRFLNKPCCVDELIDVLNCGLEQYRLMIAERELLSTTLNGSIELMSDVLAMVNPVAFGRANRVREIVRKMCHELKLADHWKIEVAAALSQIGCVTIPGEVVEAAAAGESLTTEDQHLMDRHPAVAAKLVGRIPRLDQVGRIIEEASQTQCDGIGDWDNDPIRQGASLLRMVLTYDRLAGSHHPELALAETSAIPEFAGRKKWIHALALAVADNFVVRSRTIDELAVGMILDEDLETETGVLLVTKGQQLTDSLVARLANFAKRKKGIQQPIQVRCSPDEHEQESPTTYRETICIGSTRNNR